MQQQKNRVEVQGIISILYCSKQKKMQIIPLNLDSVLLLLHNSKLAYLYSINSFFLGFTPPQIKCQDPLGIESGKIPSSAIVASSQYSQYYEPDRGRLRTEGEGSYGGGWAAQYNDVKQFLQFDLGKVTTVTAVATQGRSNANWMVTSYTLAYSVNGGSFTPYGEGDGQVSNILLLLYYL